MKEDSADIQIPQNNDYDLETQYLFKDYKVNVKAVTAAGMKRLILKGRLKIHLFKLALLHRCSLLYSDDTFDWSPAERGLPRWGVSWISSSRSDPVTSRDKSLNINRGLARDFRAVTSLHYGRLAHSVHVPMLGSL